MTQTAIQLDELTKVYDGQYAVDHLSLTIEKGEIFGLLGPNGAGKSTTILMMLGLSEPTSGKVTVSGIDSTRKPLDVKRIVGYLPDDIGFYQQMTGLENLLYTASLNGIAKSEAKERALALLKQVGLEDAADKKAGKYSRGMRQRLGLADVLMKNPEIIILDEPTLGIDPEGVRELLQLIKKLSKSENITVLLSSHQLHQVQQICDRVGIFVKGELLAQGDIESLAKQLFFQDTFVINAEVSGRQQSLFDRIEQIPGVNRVEETTANKLEIYCEKDITTVIAKTIIETGTSLHHISKKNYGLDEIYHRYFEGREQDESA